MQRRIIITLVDGFHHRYLADTGVIDRMLEQDIQLLILTTAILKERIENSPLGKNPRVTLGILDEVKLSKIHRVHLFLIINASRKLSRTLNVKNEMKAKTGKLSYLASRFARSISSTGLYSLMLRIAGSAFSSSRYRQLLNEFKPHLVVFSTPGQKVNDLPLIYEALRQKIKTISPVYSWDNLTAKGPFIFNVDKLIVWNEIMKEEAIEYHQYKAEDVIVAGVPVFDSYVKVLHEPATNKKEFLSQFGFGDDKPLISITTIPTIYFGSCHRELTLRILNFINRGMIPPSNVLLRPHPLDETDYTDLEKNPGVVVDYYGSTPTQNVISKWVPREDNTTHLARTMKYSNVVINIASTITIDAACFDTPVINIAYDMKDNPQEYVGSISRYYQYTHYQHVVKVGAAALVNSDEELLNALNTYLKDRSYHAEERKRLVYQQTGDLDGRAYQRIADAIINAM
ncbi:CDP-glycerol glycerophosphotransferase family protein [Pseudochryseolinea flava]|uniref:CDP-Glycerol:Poly(Glycerophosphate) glycerophosphotransferase n=1 Tax=Pseudochryseolinea flava TaxID=2059302 RepID=A0A364Y0E3_9BACT|nr:CDP-glycerol glycerophosphotransferase family protein [Pseudochryseolinea flava]RAV99752.1 hypothetical protein DQQ10_17040 [Pseudochryseolinea flava]